MSENRNLVLDNPILVGGISIGEHMRDESRGVITSVFAYSGLLCQLFEVGQNTDADTYLG